jgi:Domain of unknown function DUF29
MNDRSGKMVLDARKQAFAALYKADKAAWLEKSSRLIRAGQHRKLDFNNLVRYLESQARRDRREVESRLRVLVAHLLKWQFLPEKRLRRWLVTVVLQRLRLEGLMESASLRQHAAAVLADIYPAAVRMAAYQTSVPHSAFPVACPFTKKQVMTEKFGGAIP